MEAVRNKTVELDSDEIGLVVPVAGRSAGPETAESGNECGVVTAFAEADFVMPSASWDAKTADGDLFATRDGKTDRQADAAGPESAGTEAHSGLVKQLVGDGPGFFGGSHFGGEDVRVADGLEVIRLSHVKIFTTEPVPQALAPDRTPQLARLLATEGEQLLHGGDAFLVEALLSFRADAGQVAQGELAEGLWKKIEGKGDEAVGLFHVAGDLGQVTVGGQADRTAEHGPDLVKDAGLDLAPKLHGCQQGTLAAHQAAGHFVDGEDGRDGQAAFDGLNNAAMVVHVDFVAGLDQDDFRAHPLGVGDDCPGSNAKGLGLITSCNATGCVCHHGDDSNGTAAQFGTDLLLTRGEVGVEVDEKPIDGGASKGLLRDERRRLLRLFALVRPIFRPLFRGNGLFRIGIASHAGNIFAFCSLDFK